MASPLRVRVFAGRNPGPEAVWVAGVTDQKGGEGAGKCPGGQDGRHGFSLNLPSTHAGPVYVYAEGLVLSWQLLRYRGNGHYKVPDPSKQHLAQTLNTWARKSASDLELSKLAKSFTGLLETVGMANALSKMTQYRHALDLLLQLAFEEEFERDYPLQGAMNALWAEADFRAVFGAFLSTNRTTFPTIDMSARFFPTVDGSTRSLIGSVAEYITNVVDHGKQRSLRGLLTPGYGSVNKGLQRLYFVRDVMMGPHANLTTTSSTTRTTTRTTTTATPTSTTSTATTITTTTPATTTTRTVSTITTAADTSSETSSGFVAAGHLEDNSVTTKSANGVWLEPSTTQSKFGVWSAAPRSKLCNGVVDDASCGVVITPSECKHATAKTLCPILCLACALVPSTAGRTTVVSSSVSAITEAAVSNDESKVEGAPYFVGAAICVCVCICMGLPVVGVLWMRKWTHNRIASIVKRERERERPLPYVLSGTTENTSVLSNTTENKNTWV